MMWRMEDRGTATQHLVSYGIRWSWSDSCANCGCVANWHAFDLPEGATMVALPERFPCKGFEFQGCPRGCDNYVFHPATATVENVLSQWEAMKERARNV